MNYYAQGGQAHGLKALAQELPKYGRNGDSIVAHINPEEAMMLKAMGGSGTINPTTGLPEFLKLGKLNPVKAISNLGNSIGVSQALTKVFQPVEKAVVQPVSQGLASFDKAVGNAIPGGWGTIGMAAGTAMGLPTPMMVGMGALTGSGVLRPGRGFNLQGALMGGAMAYGASELGEYARGAADGAVGAVEKAAAESALPELLNGAGAGYVAPAIESATPQLLNAAPPSIGSQIMSGNFGQAISQAGSNIADAANKATTLDTYKQFAADRVKDTGDTFSGIKNLVGAGDMTAKQAGQLAAANAKTAGTMSPMMATGMTAYGAMGLQALDEQRQYLQDQANSGAISNAEYNEALAKIEAQAEQGRQIVAANPLRVNLGNEGISEGPSLYARENSNETLYDKNPYGGTTLYAMGGSVDDEYGMDEARGMMQGNLQKGLFGQGYATGGTPRFLSGGGDGMSDDIPATINGDQPARLADGEFVIPADVVSHIGNGSSKAGAKQLYSMMNKVRKARTGNPKQGKQINPSKYLPA
jgi:hypothetical protein